MALFLAVLCLGLNAFFVAAEFALVKVRVTKIEPLAKRGERRAVAATKVLSRLDRYLSVTQFGITVASLGLGWIAEPMIEQFGHRVSTRFTGEPLSDTGSVLVGAAGLGVLTFLHLLLGELVPKFVAISHSEATVLHSAFVLRFVDTAFRPVLWFLEKAQHAVLRALRIDPHVANEGALSEEEIIGILAANAAHGAVARDKQQLIERVLRLSHRPVKDAMVSRVDVVAISAEATGEEACRLVAEHQFSRIPIYRKSIDDIVGYLYAKDLLFRPDVTSLSSLDGLGRRALFVPESRDELAVVREMQRERVPFAVVVDEYGGTSGIVTLEDLVEDVFGEIRDELDEEPDKIVRMGFATWDVAANTTLMELREAGLPVEPSAQDEPLGRLIVERLGRLAKVGDVVDICDGVVGRVSATRSRRVERVRLHLGAGPEGATV